MSGKPKDITGNKYGRLTVIKFSHIVNKHSYWVCKCDCGNLVTVRSDCLKDSNTQSCGCLGKDNHYKKHGQTRTRLYRIYYAMKQRCYNANTKHYDRYGERGITICKEWLDDFRNFYNWAINNGYKDNLSIDRIDYNGNYEPSNCRFITQYEQTRNTSRNTLITIDGVTKCLKDWCNYYGVDTATACYRLKQNKPLKEVFNITSKV